MLFNPYIQEDLTEVASRTCDWDWLRDKTFLITGAYGMIASYIVFFLAFMNEFYPEMNINIVAHGRRAKKMSSRFLGLMEKKYFNPIICDISDLRQDSWSADYIVHAASLASAKYYETAPIDVLTPNIFGTKHLLDLAADSKDAKILFMSSSEIYGDAMSNKVVDETTSGVLDVMNLRNSYAESKRAGELLCKAYAVQSGVPAVIARIFHTYGPTMDYRGDSRVFAEFVSNVVDKSGLIIKSDGKAKRNYCYIADALDAFLKIMKLGESGEAYNVCNPYERYSVIELAEHLQKLFPDRVKEISFSDQSKNTHYVKNTAHSSGWGEADVRIDKIVGLGWRPKYSINDGFYRTVHSILSEM